MITTVNQSGIEVVCSNFSNTPTVKIKKDILSSTEKEHEIFEIITCSDDDFSSNIDIALLAFLKLFEQLSEDTRSQVRLTIVTTRWPGLKFIESLISSMNLKENTTIINSDNLAELKKACTRADLLLNTSTNNQVQFIKQALSKGVPVICFNNFWTQNLITNECGFRVSYNHLSYCKNIDAFSAHLYSLFTNPSLLKNLSKGAKERYTHLYG